MHICLVYLKMELKRAWKRLPHIYAGAIVLIFLMGTVALLANQMLYGKQVSGRIGVGVVLPQGDALSKQVMSMISSLESVKSICDFSYMDKEEALKSLEKGELFAVMETPEGFITDILNGTNTPVTVLLPRDAAVESSIFKELTEAGSRILGASQAGIYAGDELLKEYGMEDFTSQLELDLNQLYLSYSLPRMDYFRQIQVRATNDVDTVTFYGISASVYCLLLGVIPASGYLAPVKRIMKQKLAVAGVGKAAFICSRTAGLALLLFAVAFPAALGASFMGWLDLGLTGIAVLLFICLSAASLVVFLYQAAGSLMGGVMLLFLVVTAMHFASGGFLPLVFLPEGVRSIAPALPSYILMEGIKMILTAAWEGAVLLKLCALAVAGFGGTLAVEVVRG